MRFWNASRATPGSNRDLALAPVGKQPGKVTVLEASKKPERRAYCPAFRMFRLLTLPVRPKD
jgi:hypothetical protein